MGLIDWALVCGSGMIIKASINKESEKRIAEQDYLKLKKNLEKDMKEMDRRRFVNSIRTDSFIYFDEGISSKEFIFLAKECAKHIKRIIDVKVNGAKVYCTVSSQTGISDWEFSVDFNNWGHITGVYWTYTENYDSNIPQRYGTLLSSKVQDSIKKNGVYINDFSDEVDNNKFLGVGKLTYREKEKFLNKHMIKKYKSIKIGYSHNELIGEHVYPVVSVFRNKGFKNITVLEAREATHNNLKDEFEVFKIKVNNNENFLENACYPENAEIKIYYYGKKAILNLKSSREYKNINYKTVSDELYDLGFTNIYESKVKDLTFGIITKDGAVEKVTDRTGNFIEKNKKYDYDEKIIIYYHIKK